MHASHKASLRGLAGAIGATVAVGALAYGRKRESRRYRAQRRLAEIRGQAAERYRPWMGWSAVSAALTTLSVVRRRRRAGMARVQETAHQTATRARAAALDARERANDRLVTGMQRASDFAHVAGQLWKHGRRVFR